MSGAKFISVANDEALLAEIGKQFNISDQLKSFDKSPPTSGAAQTKSVISNNGEFSADNDLILRQAAQKPTTISEKIEARRAETLSDELRKTVENDFTLDSLRRAKIHPNGRLNPEAYQLMTHAHAQAFGQASPESFRGVFLNPNAVKAVRAALVNLLPDGSHRTAQVFAKRLLAQYDAAIQKNGSMIQIVTSASVPDGLKSAWQEERAHEFDYFEGNSHDVASRAIFNDSVGNIAMRNLQKEGSAYRGSSPKIIAAEVAAKVWVDGNDELGLSSEQIEQLQEVIGNSWLQAGASENNLLNFIDSVSDTGKKYVERFRANKERSAGNRREINTGGTREYEETDSRNRRQASERPTQTRTAELQREGRRNGENRQNQNLERALSPENSALVKRDTAFVERQFRNQPENLAIAKTEVLYARAASAPKTKIGGGLVKIGRGALDVLSLPKSLISSVDISAPGRQGLILTIANPKEAKTAFIQQIKSFRGANFDDFVRDLNLHPFIDDAETGGLYLSTLADQSQLGQREESFMSRLVGEEDLFQNKAGEKVRRFLTFHVRASERAYVSYLDSIRINTFAKLTKAADAFNARNNFDPAEIIDAETNITRREDQLSAIAQFVNYATGRGTLGKFEDAAPILNGLFFSPRFLMSRLQLLNPNFYRKLPPGVRSSVIKQMLIYAGGTAIALGLLKLAGGDVEIGDVDNPDFLLKVKFGSFHYDFGGGMAQPIRYIARMLKSAYGRVRGDKSTFGEAKESALTKQFIRSKLAPGIGSMVNLYSGTNMIGEPVTAGGEALNLVSPMIANDVGKAIETDGSLGVVKTLPSLLGIGVGIYERKDKANSPAPGDAPPANPKTREIQIDTYRKMLDSKNAKVREIGEKRLKELEVDAPPIRPFANFQNLRQSENIIDLRDLGVEKSRANLQRWKDRRQSENVIDLRKDRPLTNYLKAVAEDDAEGMKRWNKETRDLTTAEEQEMFKALRAHFKRMKGK